MLVHAGKVVPVTVVAGSAVCDTKVTPVRVVPVTPVYFIHACVDPLYTCIRHAVTVGAVATVIVTSVAFSLAASVLRYQVSIDCAIII